MLNAVDKESEKIGQKINPVTKPDVNLGLDLSDEFWELLAQAGDSSAIDIGSINSFSQISQNRETLYQVLDVMAEDPSIAAALETYTEDATEANEEGDIVWVEASDSRIGNYIRFLLDSLNVNKNIYNWMYSFIKYGDIYLRLYRDSDFEYNLLDKSQNTKLNEKFNHLESKGDPKVSGSNVIEDTLNEEAKVVMYRKNDHFANYVEIMPNPAEMFELTRFGKSYAYIKTNVLPQTQQQNELSMNYLTYKFNKQDIEIYNAVSFVHACLQDNAPRVPEQVEIYLDGNFNSSDSYLYTVRRGQSILFDMYKIWRQLMLLENSLLLNRLTKSSIVRLVQVEVGDMPKERVGPTVQRVKTLVEQKSSIDVSNRMSEYTNPGPMENNVYVPTRNGLGSISIQQLGGDVNVRDIADIDYFKNRFYAALKIPKQFLGDTDDATGFNGGTSLAITSSRYAKTIKRMQNAMCQAITDLVNILLLDRGLDTYVNKFSIKMQAPMTQEEMDKRQDTSSRIGVADDVMRMLGDVEDPIIKFKMIQSLLANSINNQTVLDLLQDYVDDLEKQKEEEENGDSTDDSSGDSFGDDFGDAGGDFDMDLDLDLGSSSGGDDIGGDDFGGDFDMDLGGSSDTLPSPSDLGAGDMTEV